MSDNTDIRMLDLEDSWKYFKTEVEMDDPLYRRVRFGVRIKFDINDYLKGRIRICPRTGKAFVYAMRYEIEQFETELERRERIIKGWLLENFGDEDIATPRGIVG